MSEPSLQEVFGAGATQDVNTFTIAKADLVAVGLTANANNKAEGLLVAILLLAKATLTTDRQAINPEQSITIEEGFGGDTLVQRNNQTYRQKTYSTNLQKLDAQLTIDPDDY